MDGMQWAFVGICLCIVAYGALVAWGWLVTHWTGRPSIFIVGVYGAEAYKRFTRRLRPRYRMHRIDSPMMRLHSVKLQKLRTAHTKPVARTVMRATGNSATSAIDMEKIETLHNMMALGAVANRAAAIEAMFGVSRSGNPRSTYARICALLDAKNVTKQAAANGDEIVINPPKASAPAPAANDDAPTANIYPTGGDDTITAPSWAESMAALTRASRADGVLS